MTAWDLAPTDDVFLWSWSWTPPEGSELIICTWDMRLAEFASR